MWILCILAGTAAGAWLLGWVTPMDDDAEAAPVLGGLVGAVSGLVAASGVQGGMMMAQAWGIVPGLGVGTAMFGLVAAAFAPGPWLIVGLAGFVAAIVGFYAAGMASGYAPPEVVENFGSPLSALGGVVLLIVGIAAGSAAMIVIGIGLVSTAATILGFRLVRRRASRRARDASV